MVISEDRKIYTLLNQTLYFHNMQNLLSGYVAANYLSVVAYIIRACVYVTRKCKFKYGQDTD